MWDLALLSVLRAPKRRAKMNLYVIGGGSQDRSWKLCPREMVRSMEMLILE